MKRIIYFTSLFVTALSVATVSAQDVPTQHDGSVVIHHVEDKLGITQSQIVQARAVLQREKPTLQAIHVQLAAEHAELARMTTFDEAQTQAVIAKYATANTEALVEREKLRSKLFAILTPAQQQRLEQLRAQFGTAIDERLLTLGDNL